MPLSPASSAAPVPGGLAVLPFRALTYRRRDAGHLARVSSPAYDLVTPEGRARLAAADPHNIVRLILPGVPAVAGGVAGGDPAASAEQAARTLQGWEAGGILVRDPEPALWVYEMRPPDGTPPTVGWLGAVQLPPPGSPAVLPHEDTYPAAVAGRRALLAATATDLEPIVLAHDPEPALPELAAAATRGEPTLSVADGDGVQHRLWRVADPALVDRATDAFARTGAVIADGHHRFAAAQAHAGAGGSGAVLALLTPMGPGGLRVEAIHRVVPDLAFDEAVGAVGAGFAVTGLAGHDGGEGELAQLVHGWLDDPARSGFLVTDGHRLVRLGDPAPHILAAVPADAPPAWRGLDVVLAHHGLFARTWGRDDAPDAVLVAHDVDTALREAVARRGVAVLLRAPSPADVAAVARAGARMPRKSTLFVPKPRTGLVLRPHDG